MFKVMIFARRKPGISRQQLIDAYESDHMDLTDRLVGEGKIPALKDYRRNYLAHGHRLNVGSDLEYDVVTEAWFEDEAAFEANRNGVADPAVAAAIFADLDGFLDLGTIRYLVVDEFRGHGGAPTA